MVGRLRHRVTVYPRRSAGQHRSAAYCHWRCTHPSVALRRRCAVWRCRRDTQEKAVTRPPQWPSGSPHAPPCASAPAWALAGDHKGVHGPASRRSTGASACRQGQGCQCARTGPAAFFGARRAAWHGRNAHTGASIKAIQARPRTDGAGRGDALQRIRRKDATRGVVLLRAVGWLRAAAAGSGACAAWQGTTRDDRNRWQGWIVASSPCASVSMRQGACNGHHRLCPHCGCTNAPSNVSHDQ